MARWLAETHDLRLFDDVISSAEIGLAKPDPAIYRLALERLRVQAGEAIFVDDLARNTEAAESIGLPSLVFESPEQLRRELTERGILP
jgi:HAD superfamily hydrolase (TIGR01509 family)